MSEVAKEISNSDIVIKSGCLRRVIDYKKIKMLTLLILLFLVVDVFFSIKLFVSAVQIRRHLGYFINMIASGDGDVLPSLQAVPVLFFLLVNIFMAFLLYLIFDNTERPGTNRLMFLATILGFIMLIVLFILIICVIAHAYSTHQALHDGIVTAMKAYANNTQLKIQMDHLQIEFQCCGSKKYDEWYSIKWMDSSLVKGSGSSADGNTPFSCCSMKSLTPCIHHNLEITGKAYQYTPEFNLSVSTRGCYEIIREKKQEVGWGIVVNLLLYWLHQTVTVILYRLLQSAHFIKGRFFGHKMTYTIWLFGCYSGKIDKFLNRQEEPPPLPPVPPELKD